MTTTTRNRPYELMLRINEDLSIGASYKQILEVLEDGKVKMAQEGALEPVTDQLESVVGEFASSALAHNTVLAQQLADSQVTLQEAVTANATMTQRVSSLEAHAVETQATLQEANRNNEALTQRVAELEQQLAEMTQTAASLASYAQQLAPVTTEE